MIGIVVATHGELGEALLRTAALFVRDAHQVASIALTPAQGPESFRAALLETGTKVDSGEGVLILTDLFGGTPANTAWGLLSAKSGWVAVTGVNLIMVVEALLRRSRAASATELARQLVGVGIDSIKVLEPLPIGPSG